MAMMPAVSAVTDWASAFSDLATAGAAIYAARQAGQKFQKNELVRHWVLS